MLSKTDRPGVVRTPGLAPAAPASGPTARHRPPSLLQTGAAAGGADSADRSSPS
jgi:hypothetical protein